MKILFGIYYTMADRASAGVYEGLRRAGHDVTVFPRLAIQDEVREDEDAEPSRHVFETLRRKVAMLQPDIVLGWSLPTFFPSVAEIEQFRDEFPNTKLVELSQYHPFVLWQALSGAIEDVEKGAEFDLILCQCHASVDYMQDYGGNAVYFPSFATPRICDVPDTADFPRLACDVLLPWATMYDPVSHPTHMDRTKLALALLDAGITNIRLYGGHYMPEHNGWMRADPDLAHYVRPEASVHETVKVAKMAKIVINTSAITPNPVISPRGYWSDRVPMTMLTGTLCLTDNGESLADPWTVDGEEIRIVDGEHVVAYADIPDAVEKCRQYLQAEEAREKIGAAGREFARAHLTEDEVIPKIIIPALEALFTEGGA